MNTTRLTEEEIDREIRCYPPAFGVNRAGDIMRQLRADRDNLRRSQIATVTPVMQSRKGMGGNCLAACLASILDTPLENVPELAGPEVMSLEVKQSKLLRNWLAQFGFTSLEIDLEQGGRGFAWTDGAVPDAPCLLAVKSETPEVAAKGYGHFVVGAVKQTGDQVIINVIHDPNGMRRSYVATAACFLLPIVPRHPYRPPTQHEPAMARLSP